MDNICASAKVWAITKQLEGTIISLTGDLTNGEDRKQFVLPCRQSVPDEWKKKYE